MIDSDQKMGLWDHIDDLRQVIIRAVFIIFFGFITALFFHEPLFNLLTADWQSKTTGFFKEQEIRRISITNQSTLSQQFKVPHGASIAATHVEVAPGQTISYEVATTPQLLLLGPLEGILQTFKVCFWLSIALTAPIWGWVLLKFALPGLNRQEKLVVLPFLICSTVCIGLAVLLAHYITIPISNAYLETFNSSIGQNAWTFGNYIDYTLLIYFGHIAAFELALLLFLGVHFGLISGDWLSSKRRVMIVLAFILGALLTPPDVFTQLMLAIPLIALYELSIIYARLRKKVIWF